MPKIVKANDDDSKIYKENDCYPKPFKLLNRN